MYAPTGSYDTGKVLNLGENRWKYALQVAYIHGVGDKWTFDAAAGQSLSQSSSYQVQAFARYALSPTWDLHAGLSHARTGATQLDGVDQNNALRVTKVQLGTAMFVDPKTQLLFTVGRDLKADNTFKESARVNMRLLRDSRVRRAISRICVVPRRDQPRT